MSKNSPSARIHRVLVLLRQEHDYHKYGPLVGPKEEHQPNPRWDNYCIKSPIGQHELREVSGPGAASLHQDYVECIHCGLFW